MNKAPSRPPKKERRRSKTILVLRKDVEACLDNEQLPTHVLAIPGDGRTDDYRFRTRAKATNGKG